MTVVSGERQPYFTRDQAAGILEFASQVAGGRPALRRVRYHVIGTADLAKKDEAAGLLQSLRSQDWERAALHRELAGANDLLVGVVLDIDGAEKQTHHYWIAMRSPFEYLDPASLLACGKITSLPRVTMSDLPLGRPGGS